MGALDLLTSRVVLNGSDFNDVHPNLAVFVKPQSNGSFNGTQLLTTVTPGEPLDKTLVKMNAF